MTGQLSHTLKGRTLTIKLLGGVDQGFGRQVCDLVEKYSSVTIQKILIDFNEIKQINVSTFVHLSYTRMLPFLEEIDIDLINVRRRLFETISKVGLNHFFPIKTLAEPEEADTDADGPAKAFCPACDFELTETLLPLVQQAEELKSVRAQMINLEKLNSIGQLSAGVAHEFNNIIAGMKGFAQLALESMHPQDIKQALDVVVKLSDRAEKITESLLSFARKKNPHKTVTDLNEVIEDQIALFNNELTIRKIELKKELSLLPKTLVDVYQLEQVFLNLITNAMHAMQPDGTLTIRSFVDKDFITIQIQDTGHGIPQDVLDKIFDPFFTTKGALGGGAAEGTGLGLSVSQGILLNHNGKIQVESTEKVGTTFTLELPIIERAQPLVSEEDKKIKQTFSEDVKTQPLKILIIDDEQPILQALSMYLIAKGHTVFTSASAQEGIKLFSEKKPDLVFLDIIMPDMSGTDVFIELKKTKQPFTTAVITGHAGKHLESLLATMRSLGKITVFRKPFNMKDINQFVSALSVSVD